MATPERGTQIGDMEYGRIPYAGRYVGDMESGRVPGIGWSPRIDDPVPLEGVDLLKVIVPKNRYWEADYPNLDLQFDGIVKPRLYGRKAGIVPACINTNTGVYHIADHSLKEIHSVEVGAEALSAIEYTADLTAATILIGNTPLLTAGGTYYFSIEGIDIDAANYLRFYVEDTPGGWDRYYTINAGGAWAAAAENKVVSCELHFRHALTDADSPVPWVSVPPTANWDLGAVGLGDDVLRTRIGQAFTAPAIFGKPSYLTFLRVYFRKQGNPTGVVRIRIFSAIAPEVQVGAGSRALWCSWGGGNDGSVYGSTDPNEFFYQTDATWGIREAGGSQVVIEATGRTVSPHTPAEAAMLNIADRVEDVMTEVMGVPAAALDAPAFAALKLAKTEEGCLYMDTEMDFQSYIETEEAGQNWKLIPTLGRLFSPQFFNLAVPVDPLHLMDEDFVSFRMYNDLEAVRQIFRIRYDHAPSGGDSEVEELDSDYAKFFYRNEQTMEIDAWLKTAAEVAAIAADYRTSLERPLITVVFEVKGHGFNMSPMDRLKITRERAMYSGGALSGVVFRIFRVTKRMSSKTTEIVAVLDSQVSKAYP